jgi:hypothetical protein
MADSSSYQLTIDVEGARRGVTVAIKSCPFCGRKIGPLLDVRSDFLKALKDLVTSFYRHRSSDCNPN